MFNLSGSEIIVILLLALVVLGPEKLPDAIRRAGRTYAELKKMGNSFQSEMRSVLDEPMNEMRETADLLRKTVDVTDAGTGAGAATTATTGVAHDSPSTDPPATNAPTVHTSTSASPNPIPTPTTAVDASATSDDGEELINRTLSGGER